MLLASAALFALGSEIERSKESSTGTVPKSSGGAGVRPAESALQRKGEAGPETATPSVRRAHEQASSSGKETHGETRSGTATHAESGTAGSVSAPAASATPRAGETAAQLSSESRRAGGTGSETGSRETVRERLGERHREAKLLGINPEALSLLIIALIISVLLSAAGWFRPLAPVLITIAGFGVAFAALDVREVLHQVDESRTSLIVIAGVLIGLHLLITVLAGAALLLGRGRSRATTA